MGIKNPIKSVIPNIRIPNFSRQSVADAVFGHMERAPAKKESAPQSKVEIATYADMVSFAGLCKKHYPSVARCSVMCEIMGSQAAYRITQIMFDGQGCVVKSPEGEQVGRVITVKGMDRDMHIAIKGKLPTEFSFQVV